MLDFIFTGKFETVEAWREALSSASDGDVHAQIAVALCYQTGLAINQNSVVPMNQLAAQEWMKKAYSQDPVQANTVFADYLSTGIFCERDSPRAKELYREAIAAGYGVAAGNLARVYRDEGDLETAFTHHEMAGILEERPSLDVALCCHYGIGTQKNEEKAFSLLTEIIASGIEKNSLFEVQQAHFYLAQYYINGMHVGQDYARARAHLHLANEDGDHNPVNDLLLLIGREPAQL